MKNLRNLMFGLVVATTAMGTAVCAHAESQLMCGDLNLSESITSSDALLILKAAVGQPVPIECGPPASVLRTGQTECADIAGVEIACPGTGQDAAEDKGVTRSFHASPDGTITDEATSLVWEAFTDDGSFHDKDNTTTWAGAFVKVDALNSVSFAGHNDWRLPTAFELLTLADYGHGFPASFSPAFVDGCVPGCTVGECRCGPASSGDLWSSTSSAYDAARAWVFVSLNGATWDAAKTELLAVRAVRGGKVPVANASTRSPLIPYAACADLNGSGTLNTTDALLDLKAAVGQAVDAQCPPLTGVPKTGQTTCSTTLGDAMDCAGSGQDGETQIGVPRTFHDNADGTISDDSTGLTWEKLTLDGGIHDNGWQYEWPGAFITKIAALNAANFAGHSDWRVPNVLELTTILDLGKPGPMIVDAFDDNCVAGCTNLECSCPPLSGLCWASTTNAHGQNYAWVVNFDSGYVFAQDKSNIHNVRAVRGGF